MAITNKTTQDFLPIKEIRDGVVVLKDDSIRMILIASSINFALQSEDSQTAILLQYQNFLNSLDFDTQILIQSRKLDIRPYLGVLENRMREQTNELMRIQTKEYIDFVRSFTDSTNIMNKAFFIVVPYDPPAIDRAGGLASYLPFGKKSSTKERESKSFQYYRTQLEQRVAVIEQGLSRTGVRLAPLGTEELIELFFRMYNPGELDVPTAGSDQK